MTMMSGFYHKVCESHGDPSDMPVLQIAKTIRDMQTLKGSIVAAASHTVRSYSNIPALHNDRVTESHIRG